MNIESYKTLIILIAIIIAILVFAYNVYTINKSHDKFNKVMNKKHKKAMARIHKENNTILKKKGKIK